MDYYSLFWGPGVISTINEHWEVGGQAVLGRQEIYSTPWLTERHGYDPTDSSPFCALSLSVLGT